MKKKIIYFILWLVLLCTAGGCIGREQKGFFQEVPEEGMGSGSFGNRKTGANSRKDTQEGTRVEDSGQSGDSKIEPVSPGGSGTGGSQPTQTVYVQVSGAVAKPGVYELEEGSRIFQAVALAGGMTEEADGSALNQAAALSDGQMVYVPKQGEPTVQGAGTPSVGFGQAQQADGKVNLNTATEAELMALPGIGEAKARSILAWREQHGSFSQIEDLMEIEGIKDGVFSKIKDSIKVD